jgi:Zn-dependent peptidase ImmA (M78 family)
VHAYEQAKLLATQKRTEYGIATETLNLRVVRQIYSDEGIRIDKWDFSPSIRAVYMCDDGDISVAVSRKLPREPYMFALVHELKHHYTDIPLLQGGKLKCGNYNANELIEKSAEVFAAEFIFPESEFIERIQAMGIQRTTCSPEDVVRLKRSCNACVSYTFLRKRLVRLGYAEEAALATVKFTILEESMYGKPIYKQDWFLARRSGRSTKSSDKRRRV